MSEITLKVACLVCFTIFFTACDHENKGEILVDELVKSVVSWNGDTLPNYPAGQPEITMLRIKVPPHKRLSLHQHPVINAGVLLKGKLQVVSKQGDTLLLQQGDPIIEIVNTWHYGENIGADEAEIIVFYAGVKNAPITKSLNEAH